MHRPSASVCAANPNDVIDGTFGVTLEALWDKALFVFELV